jgi:hypothetical protein
MAAHKGLFTDDTLPLHAHSRTALGRFDMNCNQDSGTADQQPHCLL